LDECLNAFKRDRRRFLSPRHEPIATYGREYKHSHKMCWVIGFFIHHRPGNHRRVPSSTSSMDRAAANRLCAPFASIICPQSAWVSRSSWLDGGGVRTKPKPSRGVPRLWFSALLRKKMGLDDILRGPGTVCWCWKHSALRRFLFSGLCRDAEFKPSHNLGGPIKIQWELAKLSV